MMLEYEIVTADNSHLLPLAADMREADRREVWASHRDKPYEALSRSLKASDRAWTALVGGRPVLIWGVARSGCLLSEKGSPWMLGTNELPQYWLEFLRQSRGWVEKMQKGYALLENYVHGANEISIRWLKWCGFQMAEEATVFNREIFYRFWRKV